MMATKRYCISIILAMSLVFDKNIIDAAPLNTGQDPSRMALRGFVEGDTGVTDWMSVGQDELQNAFNVPINCGKADNVVIFIGDGLDLTTVAAARVYKAQYRRLMGEEAKLSWEHFSHSAISRTYNTNKQVASSAGTATAMLSGEKASDDTVGVNQHVKFDNCSNIDGNRLTNIFHHSIDEGKWTGIVTNTRITHATPASAFANTANRNWEASVPSDGAPCTDIASQLIDKSYNKFLRVILGGGRRSFYPDNVTDPEYPEKYGKRTDGRSLTDEWIRQKLYENQAAADSVYYVMNKTDFDNVPVDKTEFLLGLFDYSHMKYEYERPNDRWGEPSLSDMVEKAIKILKKSPKGFLLLVEGGRIDHAHHETRAMVALDETVAMSDAVTKATELTNQRDTLTVVTSDHAHSFNMNGYPSISNDILGLVDAGFYENGTVKLDSTLMYDGKPYSTLSYANGLGFYYHRTDTGDSSGSLAPRKDLTEDFYSGKMKNPDFLSDTAMPTLDETHGGDDVPIYAQGPMAQLFHTTHEQNYIAHVMMYASCVGPNKKHCDNVNRPNYSFCPKKETSPNSAAQVVSFCVLLDVFALLLIYLV